MGLTVFDQTVGEDEVNSFQDLTFEQVLEDLSARFIVNLPPEEQELVRVYWQVEQAHWFYEDYVRPLNPHLPSYSQRAFAHLFISQSPYVSEYYDTAELEKGYDEWMRYKSQVPVCGGILLNETADKCLLVRGYKSNAAWSFPRGKINLEESEADCAIREVFEETGYDFRALLRPDDFIQCRVAQQVVTLFLVPGVSERTKFETQTRMEIGAIEWVPLSELPTWKKKKGAKADSAKEKKFYMVAPFVGHIKTWVKQYKKTNNIPALANVVPPLQPVMEQGPPTQPPKINDTPPPSALDVLFSRFVTNKKDEEPTPVLTPASPAENSKQDDALERLLGGLAVAAPPPVAAPAAHAPNPLLAILNGKSPVPPPASQHQNALLALLSPSKSGLQLKPLSAGGPASHVSDLSRAQAHPPDSARAMSCDQPTSDATKAKRKALLEMMVSGMEPPVPSATSSPHPAGNTAAWVAGLEPAQQLYHPEIPVAAQQQPFPAQAPINAQQPFQPNPVPLANPAGPSRLPPWNGQPHYIQAQPPLISSSNVPPHQGYRPAAYPPNPSFPPPPPQFPPPQQQQPQYRPPPAHNQTGSRIPPPHVNPPFEQQQPWTQQPPPPGWNHFRPPQPPQGSPSSGQTVYAQPQARVTPSVGNLLAVLNGAQNQRLQADVGLPGYPTGSPGGR